MFIVTASRGTEFLLVQELRRIGITIAREVPQAIWCEGDAADAMKVCLWSRIASRVLWLVAEGDVGRVDDLYDLARNVDWQAHFQADQTFAVRFDGQLKGVDNSQFGALKVKDAVVDYFRDAVGRRPNVDTQQPNASIVAHVARGHASLAIDFAGDALFKRGYRVHGGIAPLKENLAAALLLASGWFEIARKGGGLFDPMCGVGTFLFEGVLIARDMAPGLMRETFAFERWAGFDQAAWTQIRDEALAAVKPLDVPVIGIEQDPRTFKALRQSLKQLDLLESVEVRLGDSLSREWDDLPERGLIVANPPYGQRLSNEREALVAHTMLCDKVHTVLPEWRFSLFSGVPDVEKNLPWSAKREHRFYNGALPARLLQFDGWEEKLCRAPVSDDQRAAFSNRVQKRLKKLKPYLNANPTQAFRVYDRDIPEFALAVDQYANHLLVQEYAPPKEIPVAVALARLSAAMAVLSESFNIPTSDIHLKIRKQQKGASQYERVDDRQNFMTIAEGPLKFEVNLTDYLDSGLFLDHRPLRQRLLTDANEKSVLNLFCYTGSLTVAALVGGSNRSVSVDMSKTYLAWAERNLRLNHVLKRGHELVNADVTQWLKSNRELFDLILLDPPSFSNSKKMWDTLDVQRDQFELIAMAMKSLRSSGLMIFSTNRRQFKMDEQLQNQFAITDITQKSVPLDFESSGAPVHRCFEIRHK